MPFGLGSEEFSGIPFPSSVSVWKYFFKKIICFAFFFIDFQNIIFRKKNAKKFTKYIEVMFTYFQFSNLPYFQHIQL